MSATPLNLQENIASFDVWMQTVLRDINRHTTVTDTLYIFYKKYQVLETSCDERFCHCGPLRHKKANASIGQVRECDHVLTESSCFECELRLQKKLGTGSPPRCDECEHLYPVFSIRLGDLPKVQHPTESYTPHCSRKIIDFDMWKIEVDDDNYSFAFWYNKTLAECILDYTKIQLYDLETTYPKQERYFNMYLNKFMRETLYPRYVSWTQFIDRWEKLFVEYEHYVKANKETRQPSLRELIESGL